MKIKSVVREAFQKRVRWESGGWKKDKAMDELRRVKGTENRRQIEEMKRV